MMSLNVLELQSKIFYFCKPGSNIILGNFRKLFLLASKEIFFRANSIFLPISDARKINKLLLTID